jgi:hypothetical protein
VPGDPNKTCLAASLDISILWLDKVAVAFFAGTDQRRTKAQTHPQ